MWGSLTFGIKPGSSKLEWDTLQGAHHIDFRTRIIRAVIAVTNITEDPRHGNGRPLRARQIINDRVIEKGRLRQLGKKHRAKNLRERECTLDDASAEAVVYLYAQAGQKLMQGKQRMKELFFRDLGYVFVPWSEYSVDVSEKEYHVNKETLKVQLVTGKEAVWDELIAEAPEMIESSDGDASNEQCLKDMIEKAAACAVTITHEVMVKKKGGADRGERTHVVNFLDLAHNMVLTYGRTNDRNAFLRSSKLSLRTLIGMAKVLYMVAEKVLAETNGARTDVSVGIANLKMFMPRKSRMEWIIKRGACLKGKYDDM